MKKRSVTTLLVLVDSLTGQSLGDAVERTVETDFTQEDFFIEQRVKREYLAEVSTLIQHVPAMRKKLAGRSLAVDAVIL